MTVVPVATEQALRTRAWVESNRRLVDKLSHGRLAYVYLPNTGEPGYTSFNRYYFAQQNKQGAVIDERYKRRRPTVVISNLTVPAVKEAIGDRLYDRLREGATVLACDWSSHRSVKPIGVAS